MRMTARDGSATVTVSADSVRPIRIRGCGLVLALDSDEARRLAIDLVNAIDAVKTTETATLGA